MMNFCCDKCGGTINEPTCFVCYSFSKKKMLNLCYRCLYEHTKALEKADEDFFKTEDKP